MDDDGMHIRLITALLTAFLLTGCGHGRDAQWQNGYSYATDNSGDASQYLVPGVTTEGQWCLIAEKYADAGPTGGDFVAGCEAGLKDAGVYP